MITNLTHALERIEELEGIVRELTTGRDRAEAVARCAVWGFSKQQCDIFLVLDAHIPKSISMINMAIHTDRFYGDDYPSDQLIRVQLCQMRKKLAAARAQVRIVLVWGVGYVVREGV